VYPRLTPGATDPSSLRDEDPALRSKSEIRNPKSEMPFPALRSKSGIRSTLRTPHSALRIPHSDPPTSFPPLANLLCGQAQQLRAPEHLARHLHPARNSQHRFGQAAHRSEERD
jgi:hypothetical protein